MVAVGSVGRVGRVPPAPVPVQDMNASFSAGPSTVKDLFDWANYNAQQLLNTSASRDDSIRQNFIQLLSQCDSLSALH